MTMEGGKQFYGIYQLQVLLLLATLLLRVTDSQFFYGKLVLKGSSAVKKSDGVKKPDKIVATEDTTHLSTHGDVFRIHQPGTDASAALNSLSFESTRMQGYFLRHRARASDYKLKMEKRPLNDSVFDKEATFMVKPEAGIDGADMLELLDKPSWYICLRKHHIHDSALRVQKDDGRRDTHERCSFFIQDIPAQFLSYEVKLSKAEANSLKDSPTSNVRSLLEEYVKSKEAMLQEYTKKSLAVPVLNEGSPRKYAFHQSSSTRQEAQLQPQQPHSLFQAATPQEQRFAQASRSHTSNYQRAPSHSELNAKSDRYSKASQSFMSSASGNLQSRKVSNIMLGSYVPYRGRAIHNRLSALRKPVTRFYPMHPELMKDPAFSRHRLREPSLNLDGLAKSVGVPLTRFKTDWKGSNAPSAQTSAATRKFSISGNSNTIFTRQSQNSLEITRAVALPFPRTLSIRTPESLNPNPTPGLSETDSINNGGRTKDDIYKVASLPPSSRDATVNENNDLANAFGESHYAGDKPRESSTRRELQVAIESPTPSFNLQGNITPQSTTSNRQTYESTKKNETANYEVGGSLPAEFSTSAIGDVHLRNSSIAGKELDYLRKAKEDGSMINDTLLVLGDPKFHASKNGDVSMEYTQRRIVGNNVSSEDQVIDNSINKEISEAALSDADQLSSKSGTSRRHSSNTNDDDSNTSGTSNSIGETIAGRDADIIFEEKPNGDVRVVGKQKVTQDNDENGEDNFEISKTDSEQQSVEKSHSVIHQSQGNLQKETETPQTDTKTKFKEAQNGDVYVQSTQEDVSENGQGTSKLESTPESEDLEALVDVDDEGQSANHSMPVERLQNKGSKPIPDEGLANFEDQFQQTANKFLPSKTNNSTLNKETKKVITTSPEESNEGESPDEFKSVKSDMNDAALEIENKRTNRNGHKGSLDAQNGQANERNYSKNISTFAGNNSISSSSDTIVINDNTEPLQLEHRNTAAALTTSKRAGTHKVEKIIDDDDEPASSNNASMDPDASPTSWEGLDSELLESEQDNGSASGDFKSAQPGIRESPGAQDYLFSYTDKNETGEGTRKPTHENDKDDSVTLVDHEADAIRKSNDRELGVLQGRNHVNYSSTEPGEDPNSYAVGDALQPLSYEKDDDSNEVQSKVNEILKEQSRDSSMVKKLKNMNSNGWWQNDDEKFGTNTSHPEEEVTSYALQADSQEGHTSEVLKREMLPDPIDLKTTSSHEHEETPEPKDFETKMETTADSIFKTREPREFSMEPSGLHDKPSSLRKILLTTSDPLAKRPQTSTPTNDLIAKPNVQKENAGNISDPKAISFLESEPSTKRPGRPSNDREDSENTRHDFNPLAERFSEPDASSSNVPQKAGESESNHPAVMMHYGHSLEPYREDLALDHVDHVAIDTARNLSLDDESPHDGDYAIPHVDMHSSLPEHSAALVDTLEHFDETTFDDNNAISAHPVSGFTSQSYEHVPDHSEYLNHEESAFSHDHRAPYREQSYLASPEQSTLTLHESTQYRFGKSSSDDMLEDKSRLHSDTNIVHHTHHIVTVKNEVDKEKLVHGLVDYSSDRCVSLQFTNNASSRYRVISSINEHGYTPRGDVFNLKTVFKDPKSHQSISFRAYDEEEPHRQLLLNGYRELVLVPLPCDRKSQIIYVTSLEPPRHKLQEVPYLRDKIAHSTTSGVIKAKHWSFRRNSGHRLKKKATVKRPRHPSITADKKSLHEFRQCKRTYGGTTDETEFCCHFPFIHRGQIYTRCIPADDGRTWCSLTPNFDSDKRWGVCMPPLPTVDPPKIVCPPFCLNTECGTYSCPQFCCIPLQVPQVESPDQKRRLRRVEILPSKRRFTLFQRQAEYATSNSKKRSSSRRRHYSTIVQAKS